MQRSHKLKSFRSGVLFALLAFSLPSATASRTSAQPTQGNRQSYSAPFSAITSFDARTYGQTGTGIFIQGRFLNQNSKEEKKEFKLFATTATIGQVPNGLGTVPIVYCHNCEAWSLFIVKLFSHLRTVPVSMNPSESVRSCEDIRRRLHKLNA
jgi:hypothetical protein